MDLLIQYDEYLLWGGVDPVSTKVNCELIFQPTVACCMSAESGASAFGMAGWTPSSHPRVPLLLRLGADEGG